MTRNFFTYLSAICFLSLAILSCQREELFPDTSSGSSVRMYFTDASCTKTHWDGTTIKWSEGDRISVCWSLDGSLNGSMKISEPLTEEADRASFEVDADLAAGTEGKICFYGVYPASCVTEYQPSESQVMFTVPSAQTPTCGSYDKGADIMIAWSYLEYESVPQENIPFVWNRLTAHADLTLEHLDIREETIKEISLSAGNSVPLTGEYAVDVVTRKTAAVLPSNEVCVKPSEISADEDGNYNIWLSIMPASLTSMTVKVLTDQAIYVKDIPSCNVTFMANSRNTLALDMSSAIRSSRTQPSELIRSEHPRMFITEEDIPLLKTNASGKAQSRYAAMKKRVDNLMASEITFPDPLADNSNHEIGFRASDAAMVWIISGDATYLDYAKTILRKTMELYRYKIDNGVAVDWYCYSQICALCAYDWIYNGLSETERNEIGTALYNLMYDVAWHGNGIRDKRQGENISNHESGVYGITALPWYISLAFHGDGINDAQCREMFLSGYDFHNRMMTFRRNMTGAVGGAASVCTGYAFGFYPLADFNFYRTYRSATGIDISCEMDYVCRYLDYLDWQCLPDPDMAGSARDFGFGDVHHSTWRLPYQDINYHLCELAEIFGTRYPEIRRKASQMLSRFYRERSVDRFAFIRFLHSDALEATSSTLSLSSSHAIYFETMGQVCMRTGTGADDTYALFVSGGMSEKHKHYDNNHFIIYKYGYRCLDSGTRPEPGQHLSHYFARTVAHNCVTVRMPGETFPDYWGNAASDEEELPVPNDGGQNELLTSELKTLAETDDYVYLASDATGAYNSAKASLVMREFVWCMPDIFVVFDRVNSTDASYPKTWLYHTAAEPQINGLEFSETSQGGKSICRTLFPQDAVLEKIGGAGFQFWSDGRNWPLPSNKSSVVPDEDWPLLGQWRMEVKPGAERTDDVFMHIIQVGDENLTSLPETVTFESTTEIGVEFTYGGKSWHIAFDKTADFGCNIEVQ